MSISKLSIVCSAVLAIGLVAYAAEEKAKEFKATCPIKNRPAKEDKTADYKGAKVYFCCETCPKAFAMNPAAFGTRSNRQLAETGQAIQAKCPLTGAKLNPDANLDVGGVKVGFCCNDCKGKVAAAKGQDQLALVFSDAAFAKAYEVKKAK